MSPFHYSIDIDTRRQCLYVEAKGRANAKEIERLYLLIAETAKQHNVLKVYVDYSSITFDASAEDIYQTIEALREPLAGLRVARLHNPASFSYYLTNKLYKQNDLSVKNFDSKDKALNWLFDGATAALT